MATVKEAANFFGISEVSFYALVNSGLFPRKPRGGQYDIADCAQRIVRDWQKLKSDVSTSARSEVRLALLREQTIALQIKNAKAAQRLLDQ